MDINIVINQMMVLFLLIGVGYTVTRSGLGDMGMQETITKFIISVTAPAMMLSSVTGGITGIHPMEVLQVFLISIAMYLIFPFLGKLMAKFLRVVPSEENLYVFMTTFSNVGFMGFPVIRSIFGEAGVFYCAIVNMVFNVSSYSYGMALMSGKKVEGPIKNYINPAVISAFVTIALYFLKVPFHPAINQAARSLGDATTPLAMVVIGMSLARIPVRRIFSEVRIIPFTVIKQIAIPFAAYYILTPFITNRLILGVLIIIIAMPVATNCVLFATKYRNNVETATRAVFITTLCSLITIPLLSWFIHINS